MRKALKATAMATIVSLTLLLTVSVQAINLSGNEMIPIRSAFANYGEFYHRDASGNVMPGDSIVWSTFHDGARNRVVVSVNIETDIAGVYDSIMFFLNANENTAQYQIVRYPVWEVLTDDGYGGRELFDEIFYTMPPWPTLLTLPGNLPEIRTLSFDASLGNRWFISTEAVELIDQLIYFHFGVTAPASMRVFQPN